jgi:integrase
MSKSYINEVVLRDGAIKLFQRQNAKRGFWHYRINVRGMRDIDGKKVKYDERSTGETDLDEAKRIALDRYDELKLRTRNKQPITSVTFADVYALWWAKREVDLHAAWATKGRTGVTERIDYYKGQSKRYWLPYFGTHKMEEMTQALVEGYWTWRISYWSNATQQERDKHPNHAKTPSKKTLDMEQSALREVFAWGNAHKLFNFHPIIISPYSRKGIPNYRRPSFDEVEWQALNAYMDKWIKGETEHDMRKGARLNSSHIYHRKLCRLYIQFLAATGLRTGEALKLKCRDMRHHLNKETGIVHYEIAVSKHNKTGARTVIGGMDVRRIYLQIRRIAGQKEQDDWVFCNKDGKQTKGFYKTLPEMLKQSGLLYDSNGDRRAAYSLRHYYAESTLRKMRYTENAIDLLCKNMGTSRQSIENHYVRRGAISNTEDILQPTDEHKAQGLRFLENLSNWGLKP